MKFKLSYKIFGAFLIVAIIPMLLSYILFSRNIESFLSESIKNNAKLNLENSALLINDTVDHYNQVLTASTKKMFINSKTDKQMLQWLYHTHKKFNALIIVDMDGIVKNAIARYEFFPIGSQFKDCTPRELVTTNIKFNRWNNEPSMCMRFPIINPVDGIQVGILSAKIDISTLFNTLATNKSESHTQYIIDSNDNSVLFHPDKNVVLRNQTATAIPVIKKLLSGNDFEHSVYINFAGVKVIGSAIRIDTANLLLVEETPYAIANSLATVFFKIQTIVILCAIAFVLLSAFLFSRSITKPITKLLAAMAIIEAGKLDTQMIVNKRILPDEITILERQFKQMTIALKEDRSMRNDAVAKEQDALKKLAKAQKMEAIGLLVGGVAHDLNNILSGIIGYPQLILHKLPAKSELRPQIEAIQQSGLKASAIVADLLTVARGVAAERKIINLNDLIISYCLSPECKDLIARHPKIECKRNLWAEPLLISCSHIHITKSLMNLVTNAIEAIANNGTVIISTQKRHISSINGSQLNIAPGNYAILSVIDTGSGISSEDQERIFEPFYTRKKLGRSGTGLGLHIVWNTIREHNGHIEVISDHNGSTFELFFLLEEDATASKTNSKTTSLVYGNGETILVIDDIKQQRELASQMLTELGYSVKTVATGEAAISFLEHDCADLLLLDMIMEPGINGLETYRQILETNPHQKAVIASGYSDSSDVNKTLDLGASSLINKPYNFATLSRTVNHAIKTEKLSKSDKKH